ncbi:MAG TPA: SDR family oxidoreductase [Candidatus Saccharimonadales bacterium]|jgi:3-oxoacyl-[acyl-carrier protein] reductase
MKHIFVTGGAKGIGKAIVEELVAHNYKITATYHESKDAAEVVMSKYPNVHYVAVDLQDRQSLDACIDKVVKVGPIDVLVNNAGLYVGKAFEKMTEAELYQQVDLNFAAPARLIQGLLPSLKKTEAPLIVNISSQAVHARLTGEAMYSAAKAAVSTLSYVLRAELNPKGIRVTAVEPFGVNTYGLPEPSNIILPEDLAKTVRYCLELPDHLQLDTVGISHIKQSRPDFPAWAER